MAYLRLSRAKARGKTRGDLFALGCSAAIHGVAAAAVLALQDRPPLPAQPQASIAVAVLWSSPVTVSQNDRATSADAAALSSTVTGETIDATAEALPELSAESTPVMASVESDVAMRDPPPRKPRPAARPDTPQRPSQAETNGHEPANAPASINPATTHIAVAGATTGSSQTPVPTGTMTATTASSRWSVTSRVPPYYPMSARRRGIEGDVSLRVDVGADGRVRTVAVAHGSGDTQLDAAAARAVEQWRFAVAAPITIEIPILFRLNISTAEATRP